MTEIAVFPAEKTAGLERSIRANSRIAYASRPTLVEAFPVPQRALSLLKAFQRSQAEIKDFDLHFLKDILVSTGWNNNDDVFDPLEVWVARATPEHKPFNYEHDCSDIIGHIVSNEVIDEQGSVIDVATAADQLPAKFHVVTASVLYKVWEKPELQERMDRILAEIAEGKWFVSMEVLFSGFDYALKAADGTSKVVARNSQTAFLTKHLRAYGGSGKYGDYRIGRLMRNLTFSGKGLVRNPANPESVILAEAPAEVATAERALASQISRFLHGATAVSNQRLPTGVAADIYSYLQR